MSKHLGINGFTRSLLLALASVHLACGGSPPSGPSPKEPPPAEAPPSISAVSPNIGSTGGGTLLTVTGQGFRGGITVSLDGELRPVAFVSSTSIRLTTPIRAAGAVDLVATNPGGLSHRLAAGFTYMSPGSFDFNGTWLGAALAHPELGSALAPQHSDMDLLLTVRDNQLVSLVCGGVTLPLTTPVPVTNGEFSLGAPSATITGRIVAVGAAIGTIDTDDCPATRWSASKQ